MMLQWSRKAGHDLDELLEFLSQFDPTTAERYALLFQEAAARIAANPRIGSVAEHLKSEVRFFVVEPYVLYYHIRHSTVRIVRLLHGSQDAACKLDC